MLLKRIGTATLTGLVVISQVSSLQAKPLKVFILCGQSNMEGHALTKTFPAIAKDPKTADLYKEMVDAEGEPVVCEDVWISFAYGDGRGDHAGTRSGQLSAGWGNQTYKDAIKIGPEFTFGIYMHKMLGEPIVIIKNAWGGRSLMRDFRPPSAGELLDPRWDNNSPVGKFYGLTIEHVKKVLADPKAVYPGYDAKEGYELAGFVWFQGFNDAVGHYPPIDATTRIKDYSEYSRLLACLIRDLRKDLSAPDMPFVTGVIGVEGEITTKEEEMTPREKIIKARTSSIRKAMAAPAEMPEFKGNVINVFTHKYWPAELDPIDAKKLVYNQEERAMKIERNWNALEGAERRKVLEEIQTAIRAKMEKEMTKDELFLLDYGISNAGYHYHGSAKFFAQAGKAFAEALVKPAK